MGQTEESNHRIRSICIGWVIIALIGVIWSLAGLEIGRSPSAEAGSENLRNLWPYWITSAAVWLGLTRIWLTIPSTKSKQTKHFSLRDAGFIAFIAIAARVAVLLTHQPALSDDIYRYVFDGRNVANGINPYLIRPEDRLNDSTEHWPGEFQLVPLIGHNEYFTIYMPTSQYVFGVAGLLIDDEWSSLQTSTCVFRALFVLLEIALIGLLFAAVKSRNQSPWYVALYAWHPLAISEIAGSGHQDVIGITLLVAAVFLISCQRTNVSRPIALLTLSVFVKPVAALIGALILKGKALRTWATAIVTGIVVSVIVVLPFWIIPSKRSEAFFNWQSTATVMAEKWAHFGSIYEPVLWTINTTSTVKSDESIWQKREQHGHFARLICLALLGFVLFAIWFMNRDIWSGARAMLFAMVLLSTTAHPWYLLWALACGVMRMSPALWVATLTLPWGYVVLGDVVTWTVPTWVMYLAYIPIYTALLINLVIKWRATRTLLTNNQ